MFSQSAINDLYMLFVFATALAFFWIIEAAWANDKRWIPTLVLLPATIILFVIKYWEQTRFRCFIAALLFVIIFIVGGLVGYDFLTEIAKLLFKVTLWPYFVTKNFINY